jgi:nucleotide-binding universal stress UspA family protein
MYKHILVPVDMGEESSWGKALLAAKDLASNFAAKVTVMTVIPEFRIGAVSQYFPEDYAETVTAQTMLELKALVKKEMQSDDVEVRVAIGTAYREILDAAEDSGCDLIVMASHRPGLEQFLLGPNAAKVVRHARCSVFVVRGE